MSTRKDFIAAGAALSALAPALADAQGASPAPSPAPKATIPPLAFDVTAFDATLARDVPHKHLFAAKRVAEGGVFGAMRTVLMSYASIGVPSKSVFPVGVLYHTAVVLAFNDAIWNEYLVPLLDRFGKEMREDLGSPTAGAGNPYLHRKSTPDNWEDSIDGLVADAQAHFYLCNIAVSGIAQALADYSKKDPTVVYERIRTNLVPNATLAPSGSWSIHAVQERHFTLQQTSL